MSAARTAEAAARQVLMERFPSMEGGYLFVITSDIGCPLVLVYRKGAVVVQ